MLSAKDVGGLMAMMPAFATDDAGDIRATMTVDVGRLRCGLDRIAFAREQKLEEFAAQRVIVDHEDAERQLGGHVGKEYQRAADRGFSKPLAL